MNCEETDLIESASASTLRGGGGEWIHLTLGDIERSNQDNWVLIWLCSIDN